MHRMQEYMGYHTSANLWVILMMIFMVGLIVIGTVLVVQYLQKEQAQDTRQKIGKEPTPKEIIQTRLAKGEIDVEEYERIKQALEQDE